MTEQKALLLAFASLMGIVLISYVSSWVELGLTDLDEIDSNMLNEAVHVRGVVRGYGRFGGGLRMLIEQDGFRIRVVYFTRDEMDVVKGVCADVVGEVKTHLGSLEIDAGSLSLFVC